MTQEPLLLELELEFELDWGSVSAPVKKAITRMTA
jgi:hypothetical protein